MIKLTVTSRKSSITQYYLEKLSNTTSLEWCLILNRLDLQQHFKKSFTSWQKINYFNPWTPTTSNKGYSSQYKLVKILNPVKVIFSHWSTAWCPLVSLIILCEYIYHYSTRILSSLCINSSIISRISYSELKQMNLKNILIQYDSLSFKVTEIIEHVKWNIASKTFKSPTKNYCLTCG